MGTHDFGGFCCKRVFWKKPSLITNNNNVYVLHSLCSFMTWSVRCSHRGDSGEARDTRSIILPGPRAPHRVDHTGPRRKTPGGQEAEGRSGENSLALASLESWVGSNLQGGLQSPGAGPWDHSEDYRLLGGVGQAEGAGPWMGESVYQASSSLGPLLSLRMSQSLPN